MARLTRQQKGFVVDYTKGRSATQAVLNNYNTTNPDVASSMGSKLLRIEKVYKSIEQILSEASYDPVKSVNNLQRIEALTPHTRTKVVDGLKASELLLKLSGKLIDKSQKVSLSMNIDNLSKIDLLKLKQKYDKLING